MVLMVDFQNLTQIQSEDFMGEEELENQDLKKLLITLREGLENQLDPDFFQDNKNVKKRSKNNNEI